MHNHFGTCQLKQHMNHFNLEELCRKCEFGPKRLFQMYQSNKTVDSRMTIKGQVMQITLGVLFLMFRKLLRIILLSKPRNCLLILWRTHFFFRLINNLFIMLLNLVRRYIPHLFFKACLKRKCFEKTLFNLDSGNNYDYT